MVKNNTVYSDTGMEVRVFVVRPCITMQNSPPGSTVFNSMRSLKRNAYLPLTKWPSTTTGRESRLEAAEVPSPVARETTFGVPVYRAQKHLEYLPVLH